MNSRDASWILKHPRTCPEHNLPLVRHEVKSPTGKILGYCWDCPSKMTREQQNRFRKAYPGKVFNDDSPCFYHVHEEADDNRCASVLDVDTMGTQILEQCELQTGHKGLHRAKRESWA